MKYPVWFLRLLFASWMIPAGLNHFVPLFPQPMGSQSLSMELIVALLDSHLFDLVKGIELIAGFAVLFGFYTPLALLICLPISFGVFYWDAPLEGWSSTAALFGYATLLCNSLLCMAYSDNYRSMSVVKTEVTERAQLVLAGRVILGLGMIFFAVNILFLSPPPFGEQPLATQLMSSLVNSRLLYVALVFQLVAGALILSGFYVPLALTVQMSISSCAVFWALLLNQEPILAILTLAAFAINGLLMLAYLPYYKDVLQRQSVSIGEETGSSNRFDEILVNMRGRTSKTDYIPALVTVLAVIAFYYFIVGGGSGDFSMLVLMYPLFILLTRRFNDTDATSWMVLAPLAIMLVAFAIKLDYLSLGSRDNAITWLAIAATAAVMLLAYVSADASADVNADKSAEKNSESGAS